VPPLPPHISFEQAKHFATAVAKGDPSAAGIAEKSLRGKLAELKETLRPS
jgi:pyruvate dehydrogenase (quinone)